MDTSTLPTNTNAFHNSLCESQDRLFFVEFTPAGTLRPRWYLVAVDIESTPFACPDYLTNFTYYCVFQARHPADKGKSDELARWWPEWHKYHRDPSSGNIIYDERILFHPNRIPPKEKYIEWTESLTLSGEDSCSIIGPFNFDPCTATNRVKRRVPSSIWLQLFKHCTAKGLMPPTLGPLSSYIPRQAPKRQKRKKTRSFL